MINALRQVIPGEEEECRAKVAKITEAYRASPEHDEVKNEIQDLMANPLSDNFKSVSRRASCGIEFGHIFKQFNMILFRQVSILPGPCPCCIDLPLKIH